MYDEFYNEEDDAYDVENEVSRLLFGAVPEWITDTRLVCHVDECNRTRQPGKPFCVYCDNVTIPNMAHFGLFEFDKLLTKYAQFDQWCRLNEQGTETL